MIFRGISARMNRFSVLFVLPLLLLLPLLAFAGDGTDNGNGNCGIPGNGGCLNEAPEISMNEIVSGISLLIGGAMWMRHRPRQSDKK